MPARLLAAKGVDTAVFLGALTEAQLNADPFVAPSTTAVTFTITGAVASGAVTVTVPATTTEIAPGTVLDVVQGGISYVLLVIANPLAGSKGVYPIGATTLSIAANGRAIPAGGVASYSRLYKLQGGTNSDFQTQSNTTQQTVYADPLINPGGWQAAASISQSWSFTYSALVFPNSGSYSMLSYFGLNKDLDLYLRRTIAPGAGYAIGHGKEGIVTLSNYSEPADAQAFVTLSCTFTGNLNPTLAQQS
ncbi:MAG: hypothetical protein ACRCXH_03815 [Shewanella sp.]